MKIGDLVPRLNVSIKQLNDGSLGVRVIDILCISYQPLWHGAAKWRGYFKRAAFAFIRIFNFTMKLELVDTIHDLWYNPDPKRKNMEGGFLFLVQMFTHKESKYWYSEVSFNFKNLLAIRLFPRIRGRVWS